MFSSKLLMFMILCLVVELLPVGVNARIHSNQVVQFIGLTGTMINIFTLVKRNGVVITSLTHMIPHLTDFFYGLYYQ